MDKHIGNCSVQVNVHFVITSDLTYPFSRQLGFKYGIATFKSYFGRVFSSFAMDNITCNSTDKTILDCSYEDETTEDCGPDQGAGVKCYYDGEHNDCKENYVILNVQNFQRFS